VAVVGAVLIVAGSTLPGTAVAAGGPAVAASGPSSAPPPTLTATAPATTPAAGSSGVLDPTFGTGGSVSLPGGEAIAAGPNGSLWVLGTVVYTNGVSRYLNRFTSTGAHDPTFTGPFETSNAADLTTGPLITNPGGGASFAVNMCCATKKPPTSQVAVHTVSAAGKRLTGKAGTASWAVAGLVAKPSADADYVLGGVVRLSDGRMRACVSVYPGGSADPFAALVGFAADGSIDAGVGAKDTSMPSPGWTRLPGLDDCGFASAGLQQLFVDAKDRIYVVGTATGVTPSGARVVRTSASGVVDTSYGVGGRATIEATTRSYSPLTGVIARGGTLYLGMSSRDTANGSSAVATVVKLTSSGRRDAGFGSHGVSRLFPKGGASELDSIGTLPGDRLVLGLVYTSGGKRSGRLSAITAATAAKAPAFGTDGTITSGMLTWDTLVQDGRLLTIGSVLPADPGAFLGSTVLQRRTL
jgi:hypothetical protein